MAASICRVDRVPPHLLYGALVRKRRTVPAGAARAPAGGPRYAALYSARTDAKSTRPEACFEGTGAGDDRAAAGRADPIARARAAASARCANHARGAAAGG